MPDFARCSRMLPVAGAIIGAFGALALLAASTLGAPASVAAGLGLAASIMATGAFHEDGLADTADGLGGGADRQRKLEIMKDSRIGTYGGAALVLSIGLRWSALVAILETQGALATALAMIAVAAFSRVAGLIPAVALEPARADGAAQAAGKPGESAMWIACALIALAMEPRDWAIATVVALAGPLLMTRLARKQIGGQTGDIAGACQQLAEIGFLIALASR